MKEKITFDEFSKLDIKIGQIKEAERVPESDKLIKLQVDLGEETRQVVAGFGKFFQPEELLGVQVPVVVNMSPVKLMGVESNGMVLAVDPGGLVLLTPDEDVPNGSVVR
ncbi:methionine--tRNA ligase subunit beta [candidate division WWE3 bacterium]|nr:methionine--tRNA ligase subunit beta [candidate division WWE3 bacterium]